LDNIDAAFEMSAVLDNYTRCSDIAYQAGIFTDLDFICSLDVTPDGS
jgi:hypothetical protein